MGTKTSGWYRTDPTHCRSGKHLLSKVGLTATKQCKGCKIEWRRAYWEKHRDKFSAARKKRYRETYVPSPKPERAQCDKGHTYAVTGRYADGHCGECRRERDRAREKNRRLASANNSELKTAQQRYDRTTRLQRQYGLTIGEYDARRAAQNGLCAICGKPETTVRRGVLMRLSVEHNHANGRFRGLVCNNCNRALGLLNDDVEILHKMIAYLTTIEPEPVVEEPSP